MDLYLVRHGNTFESGEKVVWVGANQNPALTAEGTTQAQKLADYFAGLPPAKTIICAGTLLRVASTADAIAQALNTPVETDTRLNEIDFGDWSEKTTDELIRTYGSLSMQQWNMRGIFPLRAQWLPDESNALRDAEAMLKHAIELAVPRVILVTSNGRLRLLARVIGNLGATLPENFSVGTGKFCLIEVTEGQAQIKLWNRAI